MRFLEKAKDGGPASPVTGYYLAEVKKWFSALLLRFDHGARGEFHTHAFHSLSWVLRGKVEELLLDGRTRTYRPSVIPFVTSRDCCHKVRSRGTTWVLTFRGPWVDKWYEYSDTKGWVTLTHGRKVI